MNLDPLLAGIAAASGGSTLLCYLKIRDLTDRVWGISPLPYDFAPWTHGMVVSLVICLLSLVILTWPASRSGSRLRRQRW